MIHCVVLDFKYWYWRFSTKEENLQWVVLTDKETFISSNRSVISANCWSCRLCNSTWQSTTSTYLSVLFSTAAKQSVEFVRQRTYKIYFWWTTVTSKVLNTTPSIL